MNDTKKREIEYISFKTGIVILLYNILFLDIAIFSILTPIFFKNTIFNIFYGLFIFIIIIIIFSISTFYKKDVSIKNNKKEDLIKRTLTYSYLVFFLTYLIILFFLKQGDYKLSLFYMQLIIYLCGGLMFLLSITTFILNILMLIKHKVEIPLKILLENKENN